MGNSIGHIWVNTVGAGEDRHNMENYESGPESGELTDSDSEVEKRNALIKSLVNVSTCTAGIFSWGRFEEICLFLLPKISLKFA